MFLSYDPASGRFDWIVPRPGRRPDPRYGAGNRTAKGGPSISIDGISYSIARLAWLYTHGDWPVGYVYHLNSDKNDNRIENLEDSYRSHDKMSEKGITADLLHQLTIFEPETGVFRWRPRSSSRGAGKTKAGTIVGGYVCDGYCRCYIAGKRYSLHRLAWLYMTGGWPAKDLVIDHINGVKTDNRWANLRVATRAQNAQNNDGRSSRKSSPYRGVYPLKNGKWEAKMMIRLGVFDTPEEAREAAIAGAKRFYGEFARG